MLGPSAGKYTTIYNMIIPTIIEKNVGYDIFSRLLKDRIIFVGGREGEGDTRKAHSCTCKDSNPFRRCGMCHQQAGKSAQHTYCHYE